MGASARRFDGKVVVVTGAGQGLGRTLALAFAGHGAAVALAARTADRLNAVAEEIRAAGGTAISVPTDVGDPVALDTLRDEVNERLGPADVLVNNSARPGPTAVLWELPIEEWEKTIRVNLTGVYLCCRAFLPGMVERRKGSVIVIGSMTGKQPLHGRTPYAASKMGLVGLVRTLASEVGAAGIRVNLISPGPIAGERLDSVIAGQAEARGISASAAREALTGASPLDRLVTAAEVAASALFLASEDATAITGEDLNVSAGAVTHG